jgi:hypothetical protein
LVTTDGLVVLLTAGASWAVQAYLKYLDITLAAGLPQGT